MHDLCIHDLPAYACSYCSVGDGGIPKSKPELDEQGWDKPEVKEKTAYAKPKGGHIHDPSILGTIMAEPILKGLFGDQPFGKRKPKATWQVTWDILRYKFQGQREQREAISYLADWAIGNPADVQTAIAKGSKAYLRETMLNGIFEYRRMEESEDWIYVRPGKCPVCEGTGEEVTFNYGFMASLPCELCNGLGTIGRHHWHHVSREPIGPYKPDKTRHDEGYWPTAQTHTNREPNDPELRASSIGNPGELPDPTIETLNDELSELLGVSLWETDDATGCEYRVLGAQALHLAAEIDSVALRGLALQVIDGLSERGAAVKVGLPKTTLRRRIEAMCRKVREAFGYREPADAPKLHSSAEGSCDRKFERNEQPMRRDHWQAKYKPDVYATRYSGTEIVRKAN